MNTFTRLFSIIMLLFCSLSLFSATKQMEYLDRGVVAVKVNNGVYISWRYLGTDNPAVGFNIYRDGVKVNATPITSKTNYVDASGSASSKYVIKSVLNDKEIDASAAVTPWAQQYKTLTLKRPGSIYTPNDMSVGDVDGDGQYELFVKWDPSNQKDNSQDGVTDKVYIDCYRLDGTFLWRIDLGINIRAGAHYTQFQVYDFDGDGKCEMICKTAPGTKDGKGKNVIMGSDNPNADYRNEKGYILSGPEYLTLFDGATGAELNTIAYNPGRGNVSNKSTWGDNYGNRCDRFLACTAYLDGVHPSVVMCRGYYTQSNLTAYDVKDKKLVMRWEHHSTTAGQGAYGEGFHNLTVADVDGDGKDEIIYGSACIDDDGKLYYRTGFGHGDAMHVSDMDPERPGLEGWFVHEEGDAKYAHELRDLKTGKVIFGMDGTGKDNGRGLAADIDASHKGFECWSSQSAGVLDCKGNVISTKKPSVNFRIYWDGDLQDELLDGTACDKWNGNGTTRLITFNGNSINGTKNVPNLCADILGDWREEVIFQDGDKIYIYTTTIESKYRLHTLMHDAVYRCGVAWQNTSYNQPPHLGFYIGDGVDKISQPDIFTPGHEAPTVATLSVDGDLNQELLPGEPFSTLSFTFGGTATGVEISELPKGLVATTKDNTTIISGIPTEAGSFTIKTKGGDNVVSYTVKVAQVDGSLKRVAYVTDPTNANYKSDKILSMLKDQKDLYVREINADKVTPDLSLFDMVLISEVTPSTAPVMSSLKGINKPMLSMKVHGYKVADGAWGWAATGYGDNTEATTITVDDAMKNHPMFKDVTFVDGNDIKVVSAVNTKAITYMNPASFTEADAKISSIATAKDEANQVSILEIAEGGSINGTTIPNKYIQIGLNSSSYGNLTEDGLSIVKNACFYLMGMLDDQSCVASVLNNQMNVTFYPNPATERIVLNIESDENQSMTISLCDMLGRTVYVNKTAVNQGSNVVVIERDNAWKGHLILKVESENHSFIAKGKIQLK